MHTALKAFHPAVAEWFSSTFDEPSECQCLAWQAIKAGQAVLIASPTGSGKTLAAFLGAIDELVREGEVFGLPNETRVLYISPLKALSNDVHKNLELPLDGIHRLLFESGAAQFAVTAAVRTGDTSASLRAAMSRQPAHILVTTPESFYVLLTSEGGRRMLKTVRSVIVDEIHALTGNKRGAHLALSLERLEHLTQRSLLRIGLSATQNPLDEVACFLTGGRPCQVIDLTRQRRLDLALEVPQIPLDALLSQEAAREAYERMVELIESHRTTLVFVNTRRLAERLARALSERLGEAHVTSHHGSLSKEQRLLAEEKLKAGHLRALVATASLELGIDIGTVDLVCQWGSTGSIATFLQRAGRSGHQRGGIPKGRIFPTSRDDLIECIALLDAIRRGELDRVVIPHQPLDVLAQQIVAMTVHETWQESALYALIQQAWPYRALPRARFDAVIGMLAQGFGTRRGLRGAYVHRDGIHQRLMARKGARLTALTCGGAIPDNAEYKVILEPSGEWLGMVDEHFAIDSMVGDIFQLGNASWRILRVESGALRVEDARHLPPSLPFWFGERPGRSDALSLAVSRLRGEVALLLQSAAGDGREKAVAYLEKTVGLGGWAAAQAVHYLAEAHRVLGVLPTHQTLVFERFFDESGGMQFIIHAPFGNRVNRAWGLALRKRFCRRFNFELQAAANEEAILFSLGASQSFPLEAPARFLSTQTLRNILVQAVLAAPLFTVRWRWNAVCALAIRRFQNGRKTPPYLIRMQADDLVTAVFPDQLACLENIVGDRTIPDHPLVEQTIEDCLTEAMDIRRLMEVIAGIDQGTIEVVCRDLTEPSPLAAEIVNARAYHFLDDAPLEERRTRAVATRRGLGNPNTASDLGQLDPAAIDTVGRDLKPAIQTVDDLHQALCFSGFFKAHEVEPHWLPLFEALTRAQRGVTLQISSALALWIAVENLPRFRAVYAGSEGFSLKPADAWDHLPTVLRAEVWTPEEALVDLLRTHLGATGPVTTGYLAECLHRDERLIETGLLQLEQQGFLLRGRFTPGVETTEWCERGLLARIHRLTLNRLRQAIEPVTCQVLIRYLFRWHHLDGASPRQGSEALALVLAQLEGYETAAAAWELAVLPSRLTGYDPAWLDNLCFTGKTVWLRLSPATTGAVPVKSSPLTLISRSRLALWQSLGTPSAADALSSRARHLAEILAERGALFLDELQERSGMLKTQLEPVLGELVSQGYVSSDSFKGLRALLIPERRKQRYQSLANSLAEAGRWTLIRRLEPGPEVAQDEETLRWLAGLLLKRYGLVFRALLSRETTLPAWPVLLPIYRRMEARGEVRGGRFVSGGYGEQFALPEALELLRGIRQQADDPAEPVILSAADPLNLQGILTTGPRIPALPGHRILYRGGLAIAVLQGEEVRFLEPVSPKEEWDLRLKLQRQPAPPKLRAYL